jgi:hypothetical protein
MADNGGTESTMVKSELFQFVAGNLDHVPERRGVYELYHRGEVVFIGRADVSLRQSLADELEGRGVVDPSEVTTFTFVPSRVPWLRYDDLLRTYRDTHYGRLPMANLALG